MTLPRLRSQLVALISLLLACATGCAAGSNVPAVPAPAAPTTSSASLYLPGRTTPEHVRFAVIDGVAVMGGDIVLGPVETLSARYGAPKPAGEHVSSAFAVDRGASLWPGGLIPYAIDASVSPGLRAEILRAIEDINQTRLSMRPTTPLDRDYVVFNAENHGGVCDSYLGRVGGPQKIRVNGCDRSTVVHEILHAAGFDHEHQRPDRDLHVTIVWENIHPSHRVNFERVEKGRVLLGPYDYSSVMHYRPTAFSQNGQPTIVARVPGTQLRNYPSLSPGDVDAIARLYADAGAPPPPALPPIAGLPSELPIPGIGTVTLPGLPSQISIPGLPSQLPSALPPELSGITLSPPAGLPTLDELLAP